MEVSLPSNTAAHRNAKCGSGSSPEQLHHKTNSFPMKDLQACLNSLLKDQDESNVAERDEESKDSDDKIPDPPPCHHSEKYLSKSETFPPSHSLESSGNVARVQEKDSGICEVTNCLEESDRSFSRSKSLPASLKLIPAIKGSHQKPGTMPPRKLSVTWAPDVYDPIPTSVSHVLSSKQQQHKYNNRRSVVRKKSDKYHYKQKDSGKSSRSSSGKSKKSKDKSKSGSSSSGSSSNSIKSLNDDTGAVQGVLPEATAPSTELVF